MFGRPYKEKRYKKTIEACELQHDLDMFPDGGLTEVGERNVYNTASFHLKPHHEQKNP